MCMPAILITATSPSASAISSETIEPALPSPNGAATKTGFWRLILILLALETGLFLIFVPWSAAWNEFFVPGYSSALRPILANHYFRGALSGLGVLNLWVGIS